MLPPPTLKLLGGGLPHPSPGPFSYACVVRARGERVASKILTGYSPSPDVHGYYSCTSLGSMNRELRSFGRTDNTHNTVMCQCRFV